MSAEKPKTKAPPPDSLPIEHQSPLPVPKHVKPRLEIIYDPIGDRERDENLVRGPRSADAEARRHAQGVYYRRFFDTARNVAHRMLGDADDAKDVASEVVTATADFVNRKWESTDRALFPIVYRAAVNRSIDYRRREQRRVSIDSVSPKLVAEKDDETAQAAENSLLMSHILKAADSLPPKQFEAFMFVDVGGLKKRDAAEVMDSPEATLRSNLHVARKKLRERLKKDGMAPRM